MSGRWRFIARQRLYHINTTEKVYSNIVVYLYIYIKIQTFSATVILVQWC